MKKLHKHILFAVLVLIYAASTAGANSTDQRGLGVESRLQIQQSRLADIDSYVAEQKELIENSYQFMVASLQQRRFEYMARFAASMNQYIRPESLSLRGLMQVYGQLTRPDREVTSDRYFAQQTMGLTPEKIIAGDVIYAAESHIWSQTRMDNVARRLVLDLESFDAEMLQLERRKEVALQQLAQWEELRRQDVRNTLRDIKASAETETADVIIAVSYGRGKPSVMIGEKMLYEGDSIDGAKVLKIMPGKVEFTKAGATWVRQLGQTTAETR